MAVQMSAIIKVEFVFELARKNQDFFNSLRDNPYNTLQNSGIDLSSGEILAVLDVINNVSNSPYANKLQKIRNFWVDIIEDQQSKQG